MVDLVPRTWQFKRVRTSFNPLNAILVHIYLYRHRSHLSYTLAHTYTGMTQVSPRNVHSAHKQMVWWDILWRPSYNCRPSNLACIYKIHSPCHTEWCLRSYIYMYLCSLRHIWYMDILKFRMKIMNQIWFLLINHTVRTYFEFQILCIKNADDISSIPINIDFRF